MGLFLAGAFLLGSYQPMAKAAEGSDGTQPVPIASSILIMEATKWMISFSRLSKDAGGWNGAKAMIRGIKLKDAAMYAIPGLCYALNNNLEIYVLRYLDPATARTLNNVKILTTALFFRIIMKKSISKQQVVALLMLTGGVCIAVSGGSSGQQESTAYVTTTGIFLMLVYSMISGFGCVYNEFIMKFGTGSDNINLQNVVLYSWGLLFNGCGILMSASSSSAAVVETDDDLGVLETESAGGSTFFGFESMSQLIWWIMFVLNGAFHGLIISAVMKHLSSIWKLFMSGLSIPIAGLCTSILFGAPLALTLVFGSACVVAALYLYQTPGLLFKPPSESATVEYTGVSKVEPSSEARV
eukprot:g538.t1